MRARHSRLSCALAAFRAVAVGQALFFPSMLTDSRFVDQEFPILIPSEALNNRQEKRADSTCATTRKGANAENSRFFFLSTGICRRADRFVRTASAATA